MAVDIPERKLTVECAGAPLFARITSKDSLGLVLAFNVESDKPLGCGGGGGSYGGMRRIKWDGRVFHMGDDGGGEEARTFVDERMSTGVSSGSIVCTSSTSGDIYLQYAESGVPNNHVRLQSVET